MRQKVLVTGGYGFIGSNLVDYLIIKNYCVIVLDNLSTGYLENLPDYREHLQIIIGDIRDKILIDQIFSENEIAFVVHLAAMSKVKPSLKNPTIASTCTSNNIIGTQNLLDASLSYNVKKFIYAGSSTMYGNKSAPQTENDPFQISSPYATSKYCGELLVNTWNEMYNLPTLIFRFFMVYGPKQPEQGDYAVVTGIFDHQKNCNQPLTIEGDGQHRRDFIHVDDVCRGIVIGLQSNISGETFNLGTGNSISIKQLANNISPHQTHLPVRKHDLIETRADTMKSKNQLGFAAARNILSDLLNNNLKSSLLI